MAIGLIQIYNFAIMVVVIAGASGLIGRELVDICLSDSSISKVNILVRKLLDINNDKLEQIITDFDKDQIHIPSNVDLVFNCLGTTINNAGSEDAFKKVDYDYVVKLAESAKDNGVRTFISVSSLGAAKKSKVFYYHIKGLVEDYLMKESQIKNVFIVRPSMLLGKRREFRLGELIGKTIMRVFKALFIGNLKLYRAIEAKTVAKALLNIAKAKDEGKKIILNDALPILAKDY